MKKVLIFGLFLISLGCHMTRPVTKIPVVIPPNYFCDEEKTPEDGMWEPKWCPKIDCDHWHPERCQNIL